MDFEALCQAVLDRAVVTTAFNEMVNPVSRWWTFREAVVDLGRSSTAANANGVVDMFDQANTNQAITGASGEGRALGRAINRLREFLNRDRQQTTFTTEQAGYRG